MKEKELGERNFGFDSLKSRLNHDMQEEGITAHAHCQGPPPQACDTGEAVGSGVVERMLKRAERFNIPATAESKKAVRAARFGLPATAPSPSPGVVASGKAAVSVDQLKKRAERFGMNVSSISQKVEEDEKLKKRKERFGAQTTASSAGGAEVEAKKMKRAERFGKV